MSKGTLREYREKYPAAELPLRTWHRDAAAADWKTPNEVEVKAHQVAMHANSETTLQKFQSAICPAFRDIEELERDVRRIADY
ncbi:MAG: hypothetical protein ACRYGH_06500 [Janthinobacterium lividum]